MNDERNKPGAPENAGADAASEPDSFPSLGANLGVPLVDDLEEPLSTQVTRQDMTSPGVRATPPAEREADADAPTSHTLADEQDEAAKAKRPPAGVPGAKAPASPTPSPRSDAGADATTLEQLMDAGVLEKPNEAAAQRGALAVLDKRYELMRKLGEGGMGVVFLAYDKLGDCEVAVKTLRPKFLIDDAARQRFIDEAKQMNKIPSHASVLVVKGFGSDKKPYYIMEHMSGGSLGKLIRKDGALGRDRTLHMAIHIAKAIQYLHTSAGLIHRDIKPENVMLAPDGSARLCDFGLIRQVGIGSVGLRAGTIAYMPPEIVSDSAKNIAFDWDIYSFGAVMYEMLTGKRPYDEALTASANPIEQVKALKEEVVKRPPRPILEINKAADPALAKIATWCMARAARNRYYAVGDVLTDLERVQKSQPPLGPRQDGGAVARTATGDGSTFGKIAAAVLAVALITTGGFIWLKDPFGWGIRAENGPAPKDNGSKDAPPVKDHAVKDVAVKDVATKDIVKDSKAITPPRTLSVPLVGSAIFDAFNPDATFAVKLAIEEGKLAFVEEEEVTFRVQTDKRCHVIVAMISIDHADDEVTLVFPNESQPASQVEPDLPLVVPSPKAKDTFDFHLRIAPPHGRMLVKVIATPRPIRLTDGRSKIESGVTLLDRKLTKAAIIGANADRGDGPLRERIGDLFTPQEWSTAELVFTTKEK